MPGEFAGTLSTSAMIDADHPPVLAFARRPQPSRVNDHVALAVPLPGPPLHRGTPDPQSNARHPTGE